MAKTKEKGKTETTTLFLPGPEFWEVWKANGTGVFSREEVTEAKSTDPEGIPSGVRYGFPVTSAFAVPFWASTDDPSIVRDVGEMQLEKLGLKPAAGLGRLSEFNVIDKVGNRSLAVATVLAPSKGAGFSRQPPKSFQISPFYYPLPNDSVTIWRELGRLVLVVTRNDTPVYFQGLSATDFDETAIQEIKCVLFQLGTQDAIPGIDGVVLWLGAESDPAVASLVQSELGVSVRFGEPPPPTLPERESQLVPEQVAVLRHRQGRRRVWKRRLALFALFYFAIIAFFVGRLILTQRETEELRAELKAKQPPADAIRETMVRWESLRLATSPDDYPIEVLLEVAKLLPPRGVRLTELQITGERIFIKGEASSAPEAIKYKAVVLNDPGLAEYDWNFSQPVIVPQKGATFDATGTLKFAGN